MHHKKGTEITLMCYRMKRTLESILQPDCKVTVKRQFQCTEYKKPINFKIVSCNKVHEQSNILSSMDNKKINCFYHGNYINNLLNNIIRKLTMHGYPIIAINKVNCLHVKWSRSINTEYLGLCFNFDIHLQYNFRHLSRSVLKSGHQVTCYSDNLDLSCKLITIQAPLQRINKLLFFWLNSNNLSRTFQTDSCTKEQSN